MINKLFIISLILIGNMIVTNTTIAMLEEKEREDFNRIVNNHILREEKINKLVSVIEKKTVWVNQHTNAYSNNNCGGTGLMCSGGKCKFSTENDNLTQLQKDAIPLLEDSQKYRKNVIELQNTNYDLFKENSWIINHGQLITNNEGNCTSPLCNTSKYSYVPFALQCLLPTHQSNALKLRQDVIDKINIINKL